MKTGKENKPPGNIHREQLFYWTGRSLDKDNEGRKVLSDVLVKDCLTKLRGSLEKGLWVKSPGVPEKLVFDKRSYALNLPIACFTEWSLGESLPHTAEYGRMGWGFPKRWVIDRGGQSVTYFRHNEKGAFLRCAFRLLDTLGKRGRKGIWRAKPGISGFDELHYLLHFAKMIRLFRKKRKRKVVVSTIAPPPTSLPRKRSVASVEAQMFKRKFGMPLEFVEEREWRIIHHPSNHYLDPNPKWPAKQPAYYMPYIPGEELFTLVLPDHKVVSKVLQTDWFTERLFTPWKHYPQLKGRRVPPVTVISHSDIGTF